MISGIPSKKRCLAVLEGEFADGLQEGILMAGKALKDHFPYQEDDVNELPDDISFGGDKS